MGDATGILCVEARDAAGHPAVPRTDPSAKNDAAPDVGSAGGSLLVV